jgi:hypothetical protein
VESGATTVSITVIGGGFASGEIISLTAKPQGTDSLLADTEANANGAFSATVDLAIQQGGSGAGFPVGGVFTVTAVGSSGKRGTTAFMLTTK